jgi:hypothetical protein
MCAHMMRRCRHLASRPSSRSSTYGQCSIVTFHLRYLYAAFPFQLQLHSEICSCAHQPPSYTLPVRLPDMPYQCVTCSRTLRKVLRIPPCLLVPAGTVNFKHYTLFSDASSGLCTKLEYSRKDTQYQSSNNLWFPPFQSPTMR